MRPGVPRTSSTRCSSTILAVLLYAAAPSWARPPKESIVVAETLPLSGPVATLAREVGNGRQACVDAINARGGVNGRNIALVISDDGGAVTDIRSDGANAKDVAKAVQASSAQAVLLATTGEGCLGVLALARVLSDAGSEPTKASVLKAGRGLANANVGGLVFDLRPSSGRVGGTADMGFVDAEGRFRR